MRNSWRIIWLLLAGMPVSVWSNGWITIRTSEVGTHVAIDQSDGMKVYGQQCSFAVENGLHMIVVDKDGYRPYVDTVMIVEGADRFIPVWMEPISRNPTEFHQTSWRYQLENGLFALRWMGAGGGIGTGLNLHASFFSMRIGLFTIEPCLWGMNLPFYSGISHVPMLWLVHPRNRRSTSIQYDMAVPSPSVQFYYTPMVGVVFPFAENMAFAFSAGPQISWTHINWTYQRSDLPTTYAYTFTSDPFPSTGYQFDSIWFSTQAGILFNGYRSDLMTYFKYQDGYFFGMEIRF